MSPIASVSTGLVIDPDWAFTLRHKCYELGLLRILWFDAW